MTYIDAFKAVKAKGGLPSNALHDDYLVNSDRYKELKDYYPAWAREASVYLAPDEKFQGGKDVIDSDKDEKGRQWVLPARYVPQSAIGRANLQLFVDPKEVRATKDKVEIIPRSVKVLPIPKNSGWYDFDKETRMPIDAKPKSNDEKAKRYLWRRTTPSVRPLGRDYVVDFGDRRGVGADYRPGNGLGVGWVKPSPGMAFRI